MNTILRRFFFPILPLFTVILLFSTPANADWLNLSGAENAPTIAEISVNDDHVKLILEVYVHDLKVFIDVLPEDFFKDKDVELPPLDLRLRRFSSEVFQMITQDDEHLQAELLVTEPRTRTQRPSPLAGVINPMTGRPVPGPPEDKRVLYVELIYPFEKKPEQLTIVPPLDERGNARVSIGFVTYHKEVPVVDFRFLSGASQVTLDWDDPWYSHFEQRSLKRWQQSGLMTFLYIEPYEVRHETLIRVKDLEQWMELGLQGDEFIEIDEFEPLKKRVGEFLLQHSNVLIDGKELRPILDRTSFVKYTMTRTYFIEQPERLVLSTAMIGVIVTYLTEGIPQEVVVDWELFSERIQKVPTNAVDPAGPFPSDVTPEDHLFVWNNYLKNYTIPTVENVTVPEEFLSFPLPLGSILCALFLLPVAWQIKTRKSQSRSSVLHYGLVILLIVGGVLLYPVWQVPIAKPAAMAPNIEEEQAVQMLNSLLKNVYRAFDFREEEDVYDKLAISVSGDLLTEIYLQNRKSFEVQQAGGAQAKVKEIDVSNVSVEQLKDRFGLAFTTTWTALGTVGHWGHIHTRQNQYDAIITVEPVDGSWKITNLDLLEEKRIDPYAPQPQS